MAVEVQVEGRFGGVARTAGALRAVGAVLTSCSVSRLRLSSGN